LARRLSTKERRLDSTKPSEVEKSIKLSMKKEGVGTEGGGRGRSCEDDAT
jgi:hypothetical protein